MGSNVCISAECQNFIRPRRFSRIIRRNQHKRPSLRRCPRFSPHGFPSRLVEVRSRFVEEPEVGVACEQDGEGEALALAGRAGFDALSGVFGREADTLAEGGFFVIRERPAAQAREEVEVFEPRELGREREFRREQAEMAAQVVACQRGISGCHDDSPFRRPQQMPGEPQERRFAAAVVPRDGDDAAAFERARDVFEHRMIAERLRYALE